MTLDQIFKFAGGKQKAADLFGYTLQTFRNWKANGSVPAKAQRVIEAMSGGELKAARR